MEQVYIHILFFLVAPIPLVITLFAFKKNHIFGRAEHYIFGKEITYRLNLENERSVLLKVLLYGQVFLIIAIAMVYLYTHEATYLREHIAVYLVAFVVSYIFSIMRIKD